MATYTYTVILEPDADAATSLPVPPCLASSPKAKPWRKPLRWRVTPSPAISKACARMGFRSLKNVALSLARSRSLCPKWRDG